MDNMILLSRMENVPTPPVTPTPPAVPCPPVPCPPEESVPPTEPEKPTPPVQPERPTPVPPVGPKPECGIDDNPCMPALAMGYVPMQQWRKLYEPEVALSRATLFMELDKPFIGEEVRSK
ncbi:spore coat associated protein CotJA [Ligaoa zhengdingensis]|nr:spore coat associated protein CotJA [Ligaoa zhengdingensis]